MSKFKAEVTLTYVAEYDDDELQLVGVTLDELDPDSLRSAREEMVEATFMQVGDCVEAEISRLSDSGAEGTEK